MPVLWDTETGGSSTTSRPTSCGCSRPRSAASPPATSTSGPSRTATEIDALNTRLYEDVNNAVYGAGFSRDQDAYEQAVARMFATLDGLDARLGDRRFLFGDAPVETDWRLFTTLLRFDAVYEIHFKCGLRRIVDYAHLWPYARDLYQWPGVAETVRFDEIRRHYYLTHGSINPSGIVAVRAGRGLGRAARPG